MTEAVLLTGKRGTGKSLNAVRTIQQYMREGRIVATNLDLYADRLMPAASRAISYRLPDVPTADLFNDPLFPKGNANPIQEDKNGLLVLDECQGLFNSREWKEKGRIEVIHWFSQSRKLGWDLLLIAPGWGMIDKQIRNDLCDIHGVCRETSKIGIPIVTFLFRSVFGIKVMLPKFYIVSYFYGFGASAVSSFSDMFRQSDVRFGYNTLQKISSEFGQQGISTNLSAWHIKGRYLTRWQMYGRIVLLSMLFGVLIGACAGWFTRPILIKEKHELSAAENIEKDIKVVGKMATEDGALTVLLSDGKIKRVTGFKKDLIGAIYKVDGRWYQENIL